jgi:hypothetical protein
MATADAIERRLWLAADYRAAQQYLEIAPDFFAGLLFTVVFGLKAT